MNCATCGAEDKKMIKCSIIGSICMKCCFAISSGSPELLKKLKKEKQLSKTDILKLCSECKQELQK